MVLKAGSAAALEALVAAAGRFPGLAVKSASVGFVSLSDVRMAEVANGFLFASAELFVCLVWGSVDSCRQACYIQILDASF